MTYTEARHIAQMTNKEISNHLNISLKTLSRYEKSGKAPKTLIELLLLIGGQLPSYSLRNDFTGWSIGNGYLWSPEGDRYTQGDIRAGKLALIESKRLYRESVRKRKNQKKTSKTATIYQFPQKRTEPPKLKA